MTDELVKRLREIDTGQRGWGYAKHAADRIEELESKLSLRTNLHEECIYLLKSTEAKLGKAVKALTFYAKASWSDLDDDIGFDANWQSNEPGKLARTTLAELTSSEAAYGEAKGGKDE